MAKLTEALGLLVALVDKRLQQLVSLEVQQLGLTGQQFWVVLLLEEGALDSVQAVGKRIGIDKPAASRLVETLAGLAWVRYGDGGDSRRRPVELTPRGRQVARRFRALAERLYDEIEGGISGAQRQTIGAGLRQMAQNLDDALARRSPKGKRSKSRS